MASNSGCKIGQILAFALVLITICILPTTTLGEEIRCEELGRDRCGYAISSTGKRCVLEKHLKMRSGEEVYTCRTSEIEADHLRNWIESDHCINACGLDRTSLGISSDSLLDSTFTHRLCSPHCYQACPNIVDLYFNLAAAEGVFLPKLCEAQEGSERRVLAADIKSSGFVAPGPVHPVRLGAVAPAAAPIEHVTFTSAPAMSPY
ncbi:hypothetical protein Tsubulata_045234 [Turnera subulata]|uniref:PAR1 protein n=1 Tax=Turnera subulata TaxID=218843 RepID=A0A9Q0GHC1_9ROSI|nr:hypothetical protein Tsubulata_045234 [Turnera subulata]